VTPSIFVFGKDVRRLPLDLSVHAAAILPDNVRPTRPRTVRFAQIAAIPRLRGEWVKPTFAAFLIAPTNGRMR
jgi:hypothetical protein